MGSGRSRSNVVPVSAGGQVVTADGGGAIDCEIDAIFNAEVLSMPTEPEPVGSVELTGDGVGLVEAGQVVARLETTEAVMKLANCIERGHEFLGRVTSDRSVRIWNAP